MARFSISGDDDDNIDTGPSNTASRAPPTKKCRRDVPLGTNSSTTSPAIVTTQTTTTNAAVLQEINDMEGVSTDDEMEAIEQFVEEQEVREEEGEERDSHCDEEDGSEEAVEEQNEVQAMSGRHMVSSAASDDSSMGSPGIKSSFMVTLTDPDVLDCPICFEPLTIPVFQCENGHVACGSCCIKIGNKCPSCSWPIGYNRCRAIERVVESVKISCQNLEFGCRETVLYSLKDEHENACMYAPCLCPLDNCDFVGSSKKLCAHFRERHPNTAKQFDFNRSFLVLLEKSQKCVILQEQLDGTIFVLNHSDECQGSALNLICIGATASKKEFHYTISAEYGDSKLLFKSVAATIPKWSANQLLERYLFIPRDFIGSSSCIKLEICIDKRGMSLSSA